MKKTLLTWYGITDLKSSLGDVGDGPILSALLAEDYSDIVILGYTKARNDEISRAPGSLTFQEELLQLQSVSKEEFSRRLWAFVDSFSNTPEAHEHFINWLQDKLAENNRGTIVKFRSVELKHLNDTEGIYEAATEVLGAVAKEEGAKVVTLYLSPGTPVMAFVWAFAALRHPKLKKRLIASPYATKPPEIIKLPNEWIEWHGRQVEAIAEGPKQYDVIFHLFGEQRMPSLLGVLQFESKKHVFVNSKPYPAGVMKRFMGDADFAEIEVDPYDPEKVRLTLVNALVKLPTDSRVGFNLTGGTKLMYAGALAACRKINATPFYFCGRSNTVIFLNDFSSLETKKVESVETFIELNGNNLFISNPGHWEDIPGISSPERKRLTHELWQARSAIAKLYRDLSRYNDGFHPFEVARGKIYAKLSKDKTAEISIGENHFQFGQWPDFAKYLSGGWLEEYTYMQLHRLLKSGMIKDLRIGMEVSYKEDKKKRDNLDFGQQIDHLFGETYQELDVVFTDGRRLYIVECKAGSVKGEYVRKLESITRYFGGIDGRSVLTCCFTPNSKVVNKKANDTRNFSLVSGGNILEQFKAILNQGDGNK